MPASSPADPAERLAREASFHDVEFVEHARARAWKFYDVGRDAHDRYDELVAAAVAARLRASSSTAVGPQAAR